MLDMSQIMAGINQYYEILELNPGTSLEEVKAAYRDLVKIWHPDRFAHDPRLQQKAQEKLKKINEAYEQLQSFQPWRYTQASGAEPPPEQPHAQRDSAKRPTADSQESSPPPPRHESSRTTPVRWGLGFVVIVVLIAGLSVLRPHEAWKEALSGRPVSPEASLPASRGPNDVGTLPQESRAGAEQERQRKSLSPPALPTPSLLTPATKSGAYERKSRDIDLYSGTSRLVHSRNCSSLLCNSSSHVSMSGGTPRSAMRKRMTFSMVTQPVGI